MAGPDEVQARQIRNLAALIQSMAGLAHDFNNLLLSVRASLELIEHRSTEPKLGQLVRHGLAALDRGAQLVGRSMALTGQSAPRTASVEVDRLIRALAPALETLLGPEVGLTLDLAAEGGAVQIGEDLLALAVTNLAANARDATASQGAVSIRTRQVDFRLDGRAGRFAEIRVIDNGEGMTPELMTRAMEPFFTTRPPGHGAGLGLAQVRALAWLGRGTVLLDSEPGRGTVAQLLLPLAAL